MTDWQNLQIVVYIFSPHSLSCWCICSSHRMCADVSEMIKSRYIRQSRRWRFHNHSSINHWYVVGALDNLNGIRLYSKMCEQSHSEGCALFMGHPLFLYAVIMILFQEFRSAKALHSLIGRLFNSLKSIHIRRKMCNTHGLCDRRCLSGWFNTLKMHECQKICDRSRFPSNNLHEVWISAISACYRRPVFPRKCPNDDPIENRSCRSAWDVDWVIRERLADCRSAGGRACKRQEETIIHPHVGHTRTWQQW